MLIKPANWNAPKQVTAFSTMRMEGFSKSPYDNNLGLHVGDDAQQVNKNRQQLMEIMRIPKEPLWLNQTHSTRCILAEKDKDTNADAAVTRSKNQPLVILTADCLPILLSSKQGYEIAAVHAGWRGLCQGIVENTLSTMHSKPDSLIAWIGPSICGSCYEIGEEVYQAFTSKNPEIQTAFKSSKTEQKWLANLPLIAQMILNMQGVKSVFQSNLCTFERENEFFSYRKSAQTGRIGTLIWLSEN